MGRAAPGKEKGSVMTTDKIIHLAQIAGFKFVPLPKDLYCTVWLEQIERFAAIITAAERDECVKICEQQDELFADEWHDDADYDTGLYRGADLCAAAIRARGLTLTNEGNI